MFESLGFVDVPSADLDTERPTRRHPSCSTTAGRSYGVREA